VSLLRKQTAQIQISSSRRRPHIFAYENRGSKKGRFSLFDRILEKSLLMSDHSWKPNRRNEIFKCGQKNRRRFFGHTSRKEISHRQQIYRLIRSPNTGREAGLPDYSWHNIPKRGEMYQIAAKLPIGHKIFQMAIIY
jgi:hypothetical protein